MLPTILTLGPEFGGSRFGPFNGGTIQLGTNAASCQVVLHPSTGALPVHALITDLGQKWQVQQGQVGAGLYVRKPNGRVLNVQGAMQIEQGDAVVVGHQNGPSLTISRMVAAPAGSQRPKPGARVPGSQHLSTDAFTKEARRQIESTLVTMPMGREIYRFWSRAKTGVLFRPRNLIAGGVALVGFFGVGCMGCFGMVGLWLGLR
ncbi:MAG: hypothetical protein AB8H79_24975 [Myxococcota bacterium]